MNRKQKAKVIASGNDLFRQQAPTLPNRWVVTASIPQHAHRAIFKALREFNAFTKGNDPYGEHDCAIFKAKVPGYDEDEFLFKIDYYDANLEYGEDPYESANFVRVLTVCLPSER